MADSWFGSGSGCLATIWRTHRRHFHLHKIKQDIIFKRRYIHNTGHPTVNNITRIDIREFII